MSPSPGRGEIHIEKEAEDELRENYRCFENNDGKGGDPICLEYAKNNLKTTNPTFTKFASHIVYLGIEKFKNAKYMLCDIGGKYDNLYKFLNLKVYKVIEYIPSGKFLHSDHTLEIKIATLKNGHEYTLKYNLTNHKYEINGYEINDKDNEDNKHDEYANILLDFVRFKILWDVDKAKSFYTNYYTGVWEVKMNE